MTNLNLGMFKAYDIRTPAEAFPESLAERLALAEVVYFSESAKTRKLILARDARSTGPTYMETSAEIFRDHGFEVLLIPHPVSTCQFYFACMKHSDACGIMHGASHNPSLHTGQKIVAPGLEPVAMGCGPEGGLNRIRELYIEGVSPSPIGRGSLSSYSFQEEFIEYSLDLAGLVPGGLEGFPVFQDYLNGSSGPEMMEGFSRAGARLEPMHFLPDGRFPLGSPNPVIPETTKEGRERLMTSGAAIGHFFDGDGDRLDVYNGAGQLLASSLVYAGLLPLIREKREGSRVYADIKSSPAAILEMAGSGLQVETIRNGHSQIKEALRRNASRGTFGAVEESAHFYQAFELGGQVFGSENTLYFALLTARLWKEQPERVRKLYEIQSRLFREREWGFKFPNSENRERAMAEVVDCFEKRGASSITHNSEGMTLDAVLMRRGVPFSIGPDTRLLEDWLQVAHRVSESEAGLARWEVCAGNPEIGQEAVAAVNRIAEKWGGERYVG